MDPVFIWFVSELRVELDLYAMIIGFVKNKHSWFLAKLLIEPIQHRNILFNDQCFWWDYILEFVEEAYALGNT